MANVVLVHGAWCDGSSWSRVIPLLQDAGHTVIAVQNPLTSAADDIANVQHVLAALEGPVVLAGHSYGGVVISGAALGNASVIGLVYVAAIVPDAGEENPTGRFAPTEGFGQIRADERGYLTLDRDNFPAVFAADVDPVQARVMAAVEKPTSGQCFAGTLPAAAWHDVPTWFVISENDKMVNPDAQRFFAERMGSTTISIASSHASPVSHPQEVAAAIMDAAKGDPAK